MDQYTMLDTMTAVREHLEAGDNDAAHGCLNDLIANFQTEWAARHFAAVGFESLGSFSTLFSKSVGISPSAYRISCNPIFPPAYIPFCVCLLHDLEDQPDL